MNLFEYKEKRQELKKKIEEKKKEIHEINLHLKKNKLEVTDEIKKVYAEYDRLNFIFEITNDTNYEKYSNISAVRKQLENL